MSDNNNFWREKFFYIVLLLLIGSFGWATATWLLNANAMSAYAKDADAKMTDIKSEMLKRDEVMMERQTLVNQGILVALTEIQTDVRYIKKEIGK